MMYTSNYQWTTISILPVFDNFQFLSTCRILCILVKYIFPWPYTIPFITFTICIKAVVLRQWINSMPIATPSPFLPSNSFVYSMFPMKIRSNHQDSVSWTSSYGYEIPSIGRHWQEPRTRTHLTLRIILTYKLTLERKAVLAAEISFLVWDRNKATTT